MRRSWPHAFSISTAFSMLLLIMTGAATTSWNDQPRMVWLRNVHGTLAIAVALLVIGLLIALRGSVKRFGWIVLMALLFEIWLGYPPRASMGPVAWIVHAILAAFLFAALSVIALVTSPSWRRDPEFVQDYGWPSLRSLSTTAALLVAVQVGFGAGIRHGAAGIMPHLLGALVVALFIITVGVFATNQFPKHARLRPLAVALMVITGIQVFLGMTAFLMRMMNATATIAWLGVSVAHVATGNLTFAASVMLAIEIRRDVRPRVV